MRNILKYNTLLLVCIVLVSCGKDGCTDPTATNYNPDAKNNDNSCVILDCMDPNAINYNPNATDDNGSCTYSTSYLLSGSWNILNIEYITQIDIPILGSQTISGEANDAGNWTFLYPEQTCSNTLNFVTEGIDILGQTLPGIPIDMTSEGTWELSNNENNLLVTDQNTNLVSDYQILSVQENVCFLSGTIPFVIDTMGFTINSEIDIELQLSK
tara:strand:+ start:135 stop:773 length:639 start_codon:yes stop_codon:yes gene_type:complete